MCKYFGSLTAKEAGLVCTGSLSLLRISVSGLQYVQIRKIIGVQNGMIHIEL